jgi:hypothetical protein
VARLEALERENRVLGNHIAELYGSRRRIWWALVVSVVLAVAHVVASNWYVLPWQRVAHFERVTAKRFEVRNQISPKYQYYDHVADRPDAVFGWVSHDELMYGAWGGRDSAPWDINRGDGPGLYIRTPEAKSKQDEEDVEFGVLPGRSGLPTYIRRLR